jgi:integrase
MTSKKIESMGLAKPKSSKSKKKRTFGLTENTSNLATPTHENGLFNTKKAVFFRSQSPVAVNRGEYMPEIITRKVLKSIDGFIYREARLVHPADFNLKEPWFIIFYTTDSFNEKLIRKRVCKEEFKNIDSAQLRMDFAEGAINDINRLLREGWKSDSVQKAPQILKFDFRHFTVLKTIDYVAQMKVDIDGVKPKTFKEYMSTKATVIDFMMYAKLPQDYLLRNVNDVYVRKYFDYLKQERKTANKTYNARRTILHSVFAAMIKRDPKLFHGVNLIAAIKFLKTPTKKHTAYTDEQMLLIQKAITKGKEPHLLFFIQVMYYTLSRPEELRNLKIGDIKFAEGKILFRSEIAKTSIEEHVGINESLKKIILESGILSFPPSYFVFSNEGGLHGPGQKQVSINYFYKRIKPVISKLGFYRTNPNYTLYSFKHTGAIALYKATKDIKLVQSQCRHQSIEQTNAYLRDLGAVDDFVQLNKWKSPFE